MAFDLNGLRETIKKDDNEFNDKIKEFIDSFSTQLNSNKFEDWLQEQLAYTNRSLHELSFSMGVTYGMFSGWDRFNVFSLGDNYVRFDDCAIKIKLPEFIALDKYTNERDAYISAMDECWSLLNDKLKSLGINIITTKPTWRVRYNRDDYNDYHKILVEIND